MPPTRDRYHRQRLLQGVGDEGQGRLARSRALIVGCGALGCATADLLCRAGVGTLTIVDRDLVETTNLQRQTLFDESHVGEPKAAAATDRLAQINSAVRTKAVIADFTPNNAERIASGADDRETGRAPDLILDGTDNFETRFVLNDLAVKLGVPYLYAGAVGTGGMVASFLPPFGGESSPESPSPCLRCLFEGPPPAGSQPTCDSAGVLGPAIAIASGIQSAEAIKVLTGAHDAVRRTLLEFDAWGNTTREIELAGLRDPACPCCGARTFEHLESRRAGPVEICGRDEVQITPQAPTRIEPPAMADRLRAHGDFTATRFLVKGTLAGERGENDEPMGLTVFRDGRTLIRGTTDPTRARSIYAKYIGA